MSKTCVLYFSKYCTHCQNLLKILNKTVLKKDIHFLSIDKRVEKNEKTYLLLDDGNEILLPKKINKFQLYYYYITVIKYYLELIYYNF